MKRYIWLVPAMFVLTACDGDEAAPPAPPTPSEEAPPPVEQEGPRLDPLIFAQPGQTTFMSANENELLSTGATGRPGANGRGELAGAADEDSDGAQDPGAPAVPEPEAVPDPTREIVEADVFKLEGDLLYVLNRWRGLVIIDVSDPERLRIVGRLPFQAIPVEMYVTDGRAYVVSSDYFQYWQYDPEADPHGFHGSQVMIVDVEDPQNPEQIGALHVDGEVSDTRMVGDALYAVSKRRPDYWRYNTADWEDRTWVVSLDISNPEDIREVERIEFSGTSTLIHVAHHAVFVAAWDPNFYLTDPLNEQETLVTYVDISSPEGALRERGRFYVPGHIQDKFKMNWHDGVFRVFTQRWRSDENITLHLVRTDHPDDLTIDSTLELEEVRQSGLQATRFAGDRAYAMTHLWNNGNNKRVLHTLDLSDADAPVHAARLNIRLDISHFEVHGDRLLALGRERTNNNYRTSLALYDVSDVEAPALLSETTLGRGNSNSEANHDYKALKTFPDLGLILVPLNYWVRNGEHFSGVQLVDWVDDQLEERGRVENGGGVRRAFPVGDHLVAVGELAIACIDPTDRDRPVVTDRLEMVRVVHDVFEVDGLQVQLMTDPYDNETRLEVREFGREDDAPTIASLTLPFAYAPYVLRDGDVLHLLGWEPQVGQVIRNADLSDVRAPRLRGELELVGEFERIHNQGQSFYARYWSPYAGLPLRNQILPITFRRIVEDAAGRRDFASELRFLDLRDVDDPRLAAGAVPMNEFPFVNKVTHGDVLYSTHVEQATTPAGESLLYHVRAYVDRIDVSNPDEPVGLPSLNVPGYLVDVSDDGRLLYTVDFQWDDFGRRRNALNVLRVADEGDAAEVISVMPVSDQIHRSALRPGWLSENGGRPAGWHDRTLWLTAHKYPWWGVRSDTVDSRQPYTVLRRLTIGEDGDIAGETRASLAGYHFDLLDIEGRQAILGSTGPTGLLVLDITDPAAPVIEHTARTIGYLSRVVVNGDHVYAPMGIYGLRRY